LTRAARRARFKQAPIRRNYPDSRRNVGAGGLTVPPASRRQPNRIPTAVNHQQSVQVRTPLSLEDPRRLIESYVEYYNNVRLNSATGYITPKDVLAGRQQEIHAERDHKLEAARQQRQSRRQQAA